MVILQTAQTLANQEFVVDCAHALWMVHLTKRLVTLMLLKWFYLIVLFILCIGCETKIFNRLVICMDTVAVLPHAHIDIISIPIPWISLR